MSSKIGQICLRELDKIHKETRDIRTLMHMAGFVGLLCGNKGLRFY